MSQYDATTTGAVLKNVFDDGMIKDTTYPKNPFYAMLTKKQTGGDGYNYPVRYENSGGRSKTIATALARKRPAKFVRFAVPLVRDYNAVSFDRLFMAQSNKDEYSFLDDATREVENLLKKLVRSLSMGLFRNTGAAVGRISTVSTTTITLTDTEEICNFSADDVLVFSTADGSTASDTLLTGSGTAASVDRDAGTLISTANWSVGVPSIAANNYIFKDGDFQLGLAGLQSWAPGTAPGSTDSFYGANRYPDPTRLAGVRVSAVGDPITEAIAKACSRLGREGASPDAVFLSHAKMRDLILELGSKVEYEVTKPEDATVGFKGVKFVSPNGSVTCYADQNCPNKRLFVTKLDAWKLLYAGDDVPELQDDDGSILHREPSSDSYEARGSFYANLACLEPNETANVLLEN